MKETLRKFNIITNESDNSLQQQVFDENKLQFINSTLLLRGVSKTPLILYLNNIKQIVEAKITSGRNYLPTDFGDINKNQLDPSVRFALLSVGIKLLENQCLTPTEITYYFMKWRYNFIMNCKFDSNFTDNYINLSQYGKIKRKLEEYAPLFEIDIVEETISIERVCSANNNLFRSAMKQAERYCYEYLNVVLIPVPSISGKDSTIVFINDVNKTDFQLIEEFYCFYCIKLKERNLISEQKRIQYLGNKRKINELVVDEVTKLTPNALNTLQSFLPSSMTFVIQYLLAVTCNDPEKLLSYGITPRKKINLILRMTESFEKGIQIIERESLSNDDKTKIRRLLKIQCEKSKIFVNNSISLGRKEQSLKNSDPALYKDIINVIQQCARNLHGNSKARDDTPVNKILLLKDDYQSELGSFYGGVLSRITDTVNANLRENNVQIQLSRSTIYNMFEDAGIKFAKSPNNFTQPKLDQHYCAATVKIINQLSQIFSNEIAYLSVDAKSLIKVEVAGNLKGSVIQLMSEMKRVRCHDSNIDTLGKICLYVIELLTQNPTLWEFSSSEPIINNNTNIDKLGYINITETMIPGWNKELHTKSTPGLGVAFAHHHDVHPETGTRNANDIADLIELYIKYFTTKGEDKLLKSTFFFIMDNGKGPKDIETRFVFTLLFLKYDLDALVIVCHAGGFSKYNPVEKVNGCLSERINQYCIEFENADNYNNLSVQERHENMQKSLQRLVDVADGTTCSHTGGYIDVRLGNHPPNYDGFVFRPYEIESFLNCKNKDEFKSEDMLGYGNGSEVTDFYNLAWKILHQTHGINKTSHLTKHSFCLTKNFNNVNTLPLRGSKQLHKIFVSFGRNIPMPVPSNNPSKQNTDGDTTSPSYSNLEELLQKTLLQRLLSAKIYCLPSFIFEKYLTDHPMFLSDYKQNHQQIPKGVMESLQLLLRASKKDIHIDLLHRSLSNRKKSYEKELKELQKTQGIEKEIKNYFSEVKKYGDKVTVDALKLFLKDQHVTNLKQTNKPILLQKTFQILIESKLIISNVPLNILIDAGIISNNAIIAEQLFQEQNNGISDDEN